MLATKVICIMGKLLFVFKRKTIPLNPKKILIIRSGAIGDVLMSTPLVSELRKKYPEAEICYLVGKWSCQALKNNTNIDKMIVFDDKIIYKKKLPEVLKLIRKIRKQEYDLCFVLDKSWLFGLFSWLCGTKFRIGFDRRGEGFANNISVPFDGSKYELGYYLDLARKIGIKAVDKEIEIRCDKKDIVNAKNFLYKNKINNKILIGISPGGATNPGQDFLEKRWPINNYEGLIKRILRRNKKHYILLFGGLSDRNVLADLKNKINSKKIIIAPLNSIQISHLLMNKCKIIISHDSGAMHISGASHTKTIALFGPTPSIRFAPKNAIVLEVKARGCPCYDLYGNYKKNCKEDCMKNISVEKVYNRIKW